MKLFKINIIMRVTAIFLVMIAIVGLYDKWNTHEKWQNEQIEILQEQLIELQEVNYWSETKFNYFAVGNSITKHGICDYWWDEIGMAASSENKDYFHLLNAYLSELLEGEVLSYAYNFSIWEMQASDRSETLNLLDTYLDKKIDLITIQLGENVIDLSTYEMDFKELICYIQRNAPNAQIIIIGDFWTAKNRTESKRKIADECGVTYVDLDEIRDDDSYKCGLGTVVYDKEGNTHRVEHEGVATHPGDSGMQYIANAVADKIDLNKIKEKR